MGAGCSQRQAWGPAGAFKSRKGRVTVIASRPERKREETVTRTQGRESCGNVPLRLTRNDTSILRQPCGEGAIGVCPDLPFFPSFHFLSGPPLKSNWKAEGMRRSCRPYEASFCIDRAEQGGEKSWGQVRGRQETLNIYS